MREARPFAVKLEGNEKYQRILKGKPQTLSLRCGYVNLKPNEDIGEHTSAEKEEVIVILSGEAEISCAKCPAFFAQAHCVVYIPPDMPHNVRNIGAETLRYIYIVNPCLTLSGQSQRA